MVKQALAGVPGPRVADGDEGRAPQTGGENLGVLGAERLQIDGQQTHDQPFRNHHAHAVQQRQNPIAGHLSLKVQHQDQALKMRAIAPDDARIEPRSQSSPIGRLPTLAPIARHRRVQNQILNNDLLITLGARASRRVDLQLDRLG